MADILPTPPPSTPTAPPQGNPAPSAISAAGMTQDQNPYSVTQPTSTPTFDISGLMDSLKSTYEPTPGEQNQSDVSKRLQDINSQLAGRPAFQTQEEDQYGLPDLNASQNDLGSKIQSLQLQSEGLKNDANNAQNKLISDVQGGTDIFRANSNKEAFLRSNALQQSSISSQALTTAASLAAVQGKLQSAQYYVQRAVQQKFAPLEAEQKALQDNLQLIKNDPTTTLDEKKRADAQQAIVDQRKAELDIQKTNFTNTQNEILKYAPTASTQQMGTLQHATTPAQVAQLAAGMGLQQPQSGRYKEATFTDAFGNQYSRIFDTTTGHWVSGGAGSSSGSAGSSGGSAGSSSLPGAPLGDGTAPNGNQHGVSFDQYGLFSKTNYNPNNSVDQLAHQYLDQYIKRGTVPTASTLGRSMKPQAFAQVEQRANDLFFAATGNPLPNPEIIKGYQQQLIGNNKLLNNLNVQEGTIGKNAALLIQNVNESNINNNLPALNGFIDNVKNMLGDPNVAQFLAQNSTVSNELGSLLSLKNAQGTTVHDKLAAAQLIDSKATPAQTVQVVKTLLQEAINAHDAISSANGELYKQTDPLLQDPNNPARAAAKNQPFVEQQLTKRGLNYDNVIYDMQQRAPAGHQPAMDAKTGDLYFATPQEIKSGKYVSL